MDIVDINNIKLNNTAVALGKFQGLHKGHMLLVDEIIKLAKSYKLQSVLVSINMNDDKVIYTDEERMSLLEQKGIDTVAMCEFSEAIMHLSPEDFVKKYLVDALGVKYVVVGMDYRFGYQRTGDIKCLIDLGNKYGFNVITFDKLLIKNVIVSTTYIRELILTSDFTNANAFLGRNYSIKGKVLRGKQLGRTIGFPTINIVPSDNKLLPELGAYETLVNVDGKLYKGITNVGNNPTVSDGKDVIIETHIFDFNEDIYDKYVTVEFIRFIRKQKKFESVDELKKQLELDKSSVILHQ